MQPKLQFRPLDEVLQRRTSTKQHRIRKVTLDDLIRELKRDEELEKQAWPDAKKRAEFLKKMNGNFTHHKDAIFHGLPGQSK